MDISSKEVSGYMIKALAVIGGITLFCLFYGETTIDISIEGLETFDQYVESFWDFWEGYYNG